MIFEIEKKIHELNKNELDFIFNSAYPSIPKNLPKIIEERIISYETEYVLITKLGCSLVLWENYDIELFSDIMPIHRIKMIDIMSILCGLGIIKLNLSTKVADCK